jgi:hypothetical protein
VVGRSVAGSGKATPNFVSPTPGTYRSVAVGAVTYASRDVGLLAHRPEPLEVMEQKSVDEADHSIQKGASGS